MSTWYVRPDTSHSGTRNGTSYATAWGGWSEIVWGGGGVVGGDTLYVCGTHSYSSTTGVGAHGGSNEGTRCTIRGDYAADPGSITYTGAVQLNNVRAWTTITELIITASSGSAIFITDTATNSKYTNNTLVGTNSTSALISLYAINGEDHADVTITGNDFSGTAASGIQWLCSAALAVSTLTRVTITENTFHDMTVTNGAINLRAEDDTSTSSIITDLTIDDNAFNNITSTVACIRAGSDFVAYGICKGIKARQNTIDNAGAGGMSIRGFGQSTTNGFGSNEISNNTIRNMVGLTGGVNIFDSTAIIEDNLIEDMSSLTIDANGILLDVGCANCIVRYNTINRCLGKAGVANSGYALMFLAGTNNVAYANVGDGNRNGVHIGDAGAGQSCTVACNTFTGLLEYAVYAHASADLTTAVVKNNIFSGEGYSVFDATATNWTGENNNCFYGFASGTSNHTLGAQSITSDPLLDANYRPRAGSPCIGAGTLLSGLKDFYGKDIVVTPDIGAIQLYAARTVGTARSVGVRSLASSRTIPLRRAVI